MLRIGEVSTPLQGVVDIQLGAVGAQRPGALDSTDPAAPGVLVMETSGARPGVMLRFGSSANRMDRVAFDEAFTATSRALEMVGAREELLDRAERFAEGADASAKLDALYEKLVGKAPTEEDRVTIPPVHHA